MELRGTERIENEPHLTVTQPRRIARQHERWLVQAGFAVRADDGRLLLTAHGREVGAALFGFTR